MSGRRVEELAGILLANLPGLCSRALCQGRVVIHVRWRGEFQDVEVEVLHAECFDHVPDVEAGWGRRVGRHSLGWVCAREGGRLVGWVNVAWDGGEHAFLLDTMVSADHRQRGIARELVAIAVDGCRRADCGWVHVDHEEHLETFYAGCGFRPTRAGLIRL